VRPRSRYGAALAALATTLALVGGGAGASAQSLEQARAERAAVQGRLDEAAARMAALEAETAQLSAERDELTGRLAELEATVGAVRERVAVRVRELYKRGPADPVVLLLSGRDPDEALDRAATMSRLVAGDLGEAEVATNVGIQVDAVAQRLAAQDAALAAARAEQRELTASLGQDLERATALEARLEREDRERREAEARRRAEQEAARQRAAEAAARAARPRSGGASSGSTTSSGGSTSTSTGGKACPMARPHSFTDTWGAPRSGGRSHRGTDILGPRGQRVFAITSGVWDIQKYGNMAGHWAILKGNDGTHYWYLHLERHLVGDGARVSAGEHVATNGDTGNARGTTPHVHFEQHPGGGSAINPYPLLKRLCG
jgi:murein DD-endopeptidase MepM/ murein hydrolase activator NlpD